MSNLRENGQEVERVLRRFYVLFVRACHLRLHVQYECTTGNSHCEGHIRSINDIL